MDENSWALALLAGLAVAVVGLACLARWRDEPARRLRRGLRLILGAGAHAVLIAPMRGRGIGFNFSSNRLAVAWDTGGWGFLYGLDELKGVQVIVDGQVVGLAQRGEARRWLGPVGSFSRRVALRLIFTDAAYPHFVLDLWRRGDKAGRDRLPPEEALAEASRWLVRIDDLLNRPRHSWWETPPTATRTSPTSAKPDARTLSAPPRRANAVGGSLRDEDAA